MFWKRGRQVLIAPLGGVSGVGHNCFLYVVDGSAVVVDCGIKPQTYEEKKRAEEQDDFEVASLAWVDPPPRLDILDETRLGKAVIGIITHAHLDHVGAVAELNRRRIPVYLSSWSKRFVKRCAKNLKIPIDVDFRVLGDDNLGHGDFRISFIPLQHSIPGTVGVLLEMGKKNILHLSDFKFNGVNDCMEETRRTFQEIRNRVGKIHGLVLDVLNVGIEGFTPPEQHVFNSLEKIIAEAPGRVIISFFSSNLRRMEEIIKIAKSRSRTISISGWGMSSSYGLLGNYFSPKDGDVLLISGSQGEENSGLTKLARGGHPFLKLRSDDTVVFSSRSIDGNEEGIKLLLDNLRQKGVRIVLHKGEMKKLNLTSGADEEFLHVSGHGQRADIEEIVDILKPEIIIPFHAPEDRYRLFEEMMGNKWNIQRIPEGTTLKV